VLWELPYREVGPVALPDKSEILSRTKQGVAYNIARIRVTDGTDYAVLAGTDDADMTDVYMWHSFAGDIYWDLLRSEGVQSRSHVVTSSDS
jgi:hypothetical protein